MSDFLKTSELTETRAFVHSFVKEVQVKPGRAAGGGLGCNERGRSHLLTDLVRQINELAPNGLMTGPSLDR